MDIGTYSADDFNLFLRGAEDPVFHSSFPSPRSSAFTADRSLTRRCGLLASEDALLTRLGVFENVEELSDEQFLGVVERALASADAVDAPTYGRLACEILRLHCLVDTSLWRAARRERGGGGLLGAVGVALRDGDPNDVERLGGGLALLVDWLESEAVGKPRMAAAAECASLAGHPLLVAVLGAGLGALGRDDYCDELQHAVALLLNHERQLPRHGGAPLPEEVGTRVRVLRLASYLAQQRDDLAGAAALFARALDLWPEHEDDDDAAAAWRWPDADVDAFAHTLCLWAASPAAPPPPELNGLLAEWAVFLHARCTGPLSFLLPLVQARPPHSLVVADPAGLLLERGLPAAALGPALAWAAAHQDARLWRAVQELFVPDPALPCYVAPVFGTLTRQVSRMGRDELEQLQPLLLVCHQELLASPIAEALLRLMLELNPADWGEAMCSSVLAQPALARTALPLLGRADTWRLAYDTLAGLPPSRTLEAALLAGGARSGLSRAEGFLYFRLLYPDKLLPLLDRTLERIQLRRGSALLIDAATHAGLLPLIRDAGEAGCRELVQLDAIPILMRLAATAVIGPPPSVEVQAAARAALRQVIVASVRPLRMMATAKGMQRHQPARTLAYLRTWAYYTAGTPIRSTFRLFLLVMQLPHVSLCQTRVTVKAGSDCALCFSGLCGGRGVQLTCGHGIHSDCFSAWFAIENRCPKCEKPGTAPPVGGGVAMDADASDEDDGDHEQQRKRAKN